MEILKEDYVNIHLIDFFEAGKLNLKETLHLSRCFISETICRIRTEAFIKYGIANFILMYINIIWPKYISLRDPEATLSI